MFIHILGNYKTFYLTRPQCCDSSSMFIWSSKNFKKIKIKETDVLRPESEFRDLILRIYFFILRVYIQSAIIL